MSGLQSKQTGSAVSEETLVFVVTSQESHLQPSNTEMLNPHSRTMTQIPNRSRHFVSATYHRRAKTEEATVSRFRCSWTLLLNREVRKNRFSASGLPKRNVFTLKTHKMQNQLGQKKPGFRAAGRSRKRGIKVIRVVCACICNTRKHKYFDCSV